MESKVTAELIAGKIQQNPTLDAHYIQSLPRLIHIAKGSIAFFGLYWQYFTEALICLCEFLELIYANQTTSKTSTEKVTNERHSKKPTARPFANFTDKLQNGFTEQGLNGLLVRMLMKDRAGNTLDFKKYILHSIIDALISENYFDGGNREKDQKALLRFLGLPETRIKNGYGKTGEESAARLKAVTYLQKEHKKNGSNLVP